jgi:RNA polymerase sigma-70 factor, ECF subfamily
MTALQSARIAPPPRKGPPRSGRTSRRHLWQVEPGPRIDLPPPVATDRLSELLVRCALQDERALAEIYRISSAKLFAVAVHVTRRRDWAEEVLQDSFINIWRNACRYDKTQSAPMTWMTTIVRNRAIDQLRRPREVEANQSHEDLLALIPDEQPGPEYMLQHTSDSGRLAKCMRRLNDEQRRSIMLAFYSGLSHAEVAASLGRPLGTVKTWIRRGLERLRDCLDGR